MAATERHGGGDLSVACIALVEDELQLAGLVAAALRDEGHHVVPLADGEAVARSLLDPSQPRPDLIILDLMLPKIDGIEVCRRVRQQSITPILMLTAKSTELDKVLGLELGADDYLTKPFSMRELLARVNAILRRVALMRAESRTVDDGLAPIVHPGLTVDPVGRTVEADDRAVQLTAREFDLLRLLAAHPGRVFSRDYLLDRLWGDDFQGFDRTVDTHILRLRRKLGGPGSAADQIVTLWGIGYKYERPAAKRDA